MKSMKRIMAVLLILMMTFAMVTTASAAETGSITVSGTISGKTYDIYKIFDLTYSGDNVAYTIDSDWVSFFIGSGAPGAAYLLKSQPTGKNLDALTYNRTTYYINIEESNVAEFAQKALAWCADNNPAADSTKQATGTTLQFTGVALGYYLVYPQGATDIKDTYASICSLTNVKPNGETVVKATCPEVTKVVDDASVEVGQVVTFTVTGKVPDTTGYTSYIYELKDTMTKGLTFNDDVDNISVKFGTAKITVPATSVTYKIANNGFDLKFDMTNYQQYKGQEITITYQAVVNDAAIATLTENNLTLTYSNDPQFPSQTTTTPPEIVQVYTSKIVIDKYDGKDNTKKLKDAEFVLIKKAGNTEVYYKYTAATSSTDAKVEWVSNIANATVVVTDAKGEGEFKGLEDGTYYLRETKSPAGYNLLPDDQEVIVNHTTSAGKPVGVSVPAEVANNSGVVLPTTGGAGTTLLIILGSVLFMATILVLVTKKRMYNEGC